MSSSLSCATRVSSVSTTRSHSHSTTCYASMVHMNNKKIVTTPLKQHQQKQAYTWQKSKKKLTQAVHSSSCGTNSRLLSATTLPATGATRASSSRVCRVFADTSSEQGPLLRRPELRSLVEEKADGLSSNSGEEQVGNTAVDTSNNGNNENNTKRSITVEEQREIAKDLVKYFKDQSLMQSTRAESMIGWTRGNEIMNGRWVMFGLLVGLLTEFATGVNFVDQIKITISNLGIADIYE